MEDSINDIQDSMEQKTEIMKSGESNFEKEIKFCENGQIIFPEVTVANLDEALKFSRYQENVILGQMKNNNASIIDQVKMMLRKISPNENYKFGYLDKDLSKVMDSLAIKLKYRLKSLINRRKIFLNKNLGENMIDEWEKYYIMEKIFLENLNMRDLDENKIYELDNDFVIEKFNELLDRIPSDNNTETERMRMKCQDVIFDALGISM